LIAPLLLPLLSKRRFNKYRHGNEQNTANAVTRAGQKALSGSGKEILWEVNGEKHSARLFSPKNHLEIFGMPIAAHPAQASSAVRVDLSAIFVSLELSQSKWLITVELH
jgi:transposase